VALSPGDLGTPCPGAAGVSGRASRELTGAATAGADTMGEMRPRAVPRTPSRLARWVGAATFAALVSLAPAGVPLVTSTGTPYAWDLDEQGAANVGGDVVTYFLDRNAPSNFDRGTNGLGHVAAREAGIRRWETPATAAIRFAEDTSRPASGHDANDRVNWVGFVEDGLGPFTFAVTFPTRSGARMIDADVALNGGAFTWSSSTPGRSGMADIEGLVAHEWGHAIGADHVPLRGSTMYWSTEEGAISLRSLSEDDRALVGTLYPDREFRQTTGSIRGFVTHFAPQDHRSIHVIAISVASGEPAASTLTAPDGSYAIEGLRQGSYFVLAAPTVPLNPAMNGYWRQGVTTFVPAWLREDGANPGALIPLAVTPGLATVAPDFQVREASQPFEPNDGIGNATSIVLGDGVCARLESGTDLDHFRFEGQQGQVVTASVFAQRIGSSVDPALVLMQSSGQAVASSDDIRPRASDRFSPAGPDLDAHVLAVELPADGTYFLRLRRQNGGTAQDAFYALMLSAASDAPSGALTEVSAGRARLDAGGTAETTLRVRPRRENGLAVGPGATIEITGIGRGTLSPVVDEGDGTYTARLVSAPEPGVERFTVKVTTDAGIAVLPDVLLIVYLGPVDGTQTTFTASPRRIDADGEAESVLTLRPRDAHGEDLGTGRSVVMQLPAGSNATLSPPASGLDGTYRASVRGSDQLGSVLVTASVDGRAAGVAAEVVFGFPLDEVLDQALLDLDATLQRDDLRRAARAPLKGSVKQIEKAIPDASDGPAGAREGAALRRTRKAVGKLDRALRKGKGTVPDLGTAGELSRSIRDAARAAIQRALIVTGKDQDRVDRAQRLMQDGQTLFDVRRVKQAARRWLRAYRKVRKLANR